MVMAPKVPILQQANLLGKGPEITVLSLATDKSGDDIGYLQAQARIVSHPQGLHCGNEIFANKLNCPGNQLGRGLAVAHAKHFEHARIGLWRAKEPVFDVGFDALAHEVAKSKLPVGQRIKLEPPSVRQSVSWNRHSRRQKCV